MNRSEILEKSRAENHGMDERELTILAAAGKSAAQVGMLACCLVAVLQVITTGTISFESWMIYFSILGTIFAVKYKKLRQRHELLITVFYWVLFAFFTALFLYRLLG